MRGSSCIQACDRSKNVCLSGRGGFWLVDRHCRREDFRNVAGLLLWRKNSLGRVGRWKPGVSRAPYVLAGRVNSGCVNGLVMHG